MELHPLPAQRRRIAPIDGPRDGMADRLGNRRLARQASKEGCDDFWKKASASTLRCVALDCVAPFERDEIFTGRRIGSGSFSDVYEIKAFQLSRGGCYTPEEQRKREAMARDADSKYVIKHLKPSLEESERFPAAAYDISHEAEMLSALDHPNVVKIHGICARGHDAFLDGCEGYFIVLERLDTTLDRRLKIWSESRARAQNPMKLLKRGRVGSSDTEESPPSFVAKMGMASSLASAVEYLHSNGILFRDLKPDNVGFDSSGNVRLLDFGLAGVLPPAKAVDNDVFTMSIAGSPRYSSPEVLLQHPYGKGHDVWSFSLVLWELLSLQRPFAGCKDSEELARTIIWKKERPPLEAKWPR
ncbi:hypothetical protein ACHAXT_003010, partial [Thalassiosira profunda]